MANAAGEGGGGTYLAPSYKPVISIPKPPQSAPAPPSTGVPPQASPAPQIPGAGTYLQDQAQAQHAFETAQNDINFRRGQMYSEFGLLNNGQVDPNSQYGKYQQMLSADAGAMHQAKMSGRSRGLGNQGLGARVMEALRNQQGAEHFDFQNTLLNNLHGFDVEGENAQNNLSAAMLQAQHAQEQWDFDHNQFTPAPPVPSGATPAPTAQPPLKKATATTTTKKALAQHLAAKKVATIRRP